eukprot:6127834-Pleurochrysis_carterae.AAC.2
MEIAVVVSTAGEAEGFLRGEKAQGRRGQSSTRDQRLNRQGNSSNHRELGSRAGKKATSRHPA